MARAIEATISVLLVIAAIAMPARAGAALPDGRAYELVSAAEKEGQQVGGLEPLGGIFSSPIAAENGGTVVYDTFGVFGNAVSNGVLSTYLSRRSASGWSSEEISPPLEPSPGLITGGFYGFTEDLKKGLMIGPRVPALTPDASTGTNNLYLRDNADGSLRLVTVGTPADEGEVIWTPVGGMSADGGHVVIVSPFELTTDSATAQNPYLYDWTAATGTLSLVGYLPNETVSPNLVTIAGKQRQRPISSDGSRIFFRTLGHGGTEQVFVRIDEASTREVSESQKAVADPTPHESKFWVASADGSIAYFTSAEKLTDDATTGPADGGNDLYRYDVETEELTDITVDPAEEAANGAQVQGVLGSSSDGSRVYFVAQGDLAAGATAGQNNLYLWTDDGSAKGAIEFIATGTTSGVFTGNWAEEKPTSRVTPNGMHLAFTADNSLTGYPDGGNSEVYLYSAADGDLACASCNPTAEPATSGATISGAFQEQMERLPRNLSNDGSRLFFSTTEALVPQDSNNEEDVYEYDSAAGEVALISTGTSQGKTLFEDASASGDDAFFLTTQQLVGIDQDEAADLYDARVGGGIAAQNPPGPPPPCVAQECRAPSAATPPALVPGSAVLSGPGNLNSDNCAKLRRRAKRLSSEAKKLRRRAGSESGAQGQKTRRRANRLAKQAKKLRAKAKRCRSTSGGAAK